MVFQYRIYLGRSENELKLSTIIQDISNDALQKNDDTFFSAVITHSYYSIFFAAKAYLIKKGIKISPPQEHKKTYDELQKLAKEGTIDQELLKIYKKVLINYRA